MPLYVLATPIGNLGDLSPRARRALGEASVIAAEDTRVTRRLLSALEIEAPPLISYNGHQESNKADGLADRVAAGETVVLVSDAGTPAISDPGALLVERCHARGLPVRAIAGPSAAIAALSVSGLAPIPSQFLGFPPRKPGARRRWWVDAARRPGTSICFESPNRAAALVADVAAISPDREICLCREITKLHEEILRLPAPEMAESLAGRARIRGEVVLVIGPGAPPPEETSEVGDGLKGIAKALAERWGIPKREAYQRLLALERALEEER